MADKVKERLRKAREALQDGYDNLKRGDFEGAEKDFCRCDSYIKEGLDELSGVLEPILGGKNDLQNSRN